MERIDDPRLFQARCDELRAQGRQLALVPTMGALHEGHLSLIDEAKRHGDVVALTIFVNPTQFGPNEDLAKYPKELEADLDKCRECGVGLVFTPNVEAMYVPGDATRVRVSGLSRGLCGASRPDHFEGVCTVVSKLFSLAGPCTAVFGRKDYQQWKIIERMALDLFFPVRVASAPIVREHDGLAMSSRNRRLSEQARRGAVGLVQGLASAELAFAGGQRGVVEVTRRFLDVAVAAGVRIDYASVVDSQTLEPFETELPGEALLAVAGFVGDVRLIDNVVLRHGHTTLSAFVAGGH